MTTRRTKTKHLIAMQKAGIELSDESQSYLKDMREDEELGVLFEENHVSQEEPAPPDLESSSDEWVSYLIHNPEEPLRAINIDYTGEDGRQQFDCWKELCAKNPRNSLNILIEVSNKLDEWPSSRWDAALLSWEGMIKDKANKPQAEAEDESQTQEAIVQDPETDILLILDHLNRLSEENLEKIKYSGSAFVETVLPMLITKGEPNEKDKAILSFIDKSLSASEKISSDLNDNDKDHLDHAMNSFPGGLAEIVIQYQIIKSPEYSDGLNKDIKPAFEKIIGQLKSPDYYGHIIIAQRVIDFFLWDQEWTQDNLIPLFSFENKHLAEVMWTGYLYDARWTPDFIQAIKEDLLAFPLEKSFLNEDLKKRCAHLLINLYLFDGGVLQNDELQDRLNHLQHDTLVNFLVAISFRAENAEKKGMFWNEVVKPFFENIWPKNHQQIHHESMSKYYLEIILNSDECFEEAVRCLKDHLVFNSEKFLYLENKLKHFVESNKKSSNITAGDDTDKEHTDKEHTDKEHTDKEHTDKEQTTFNYAKRFPEASLQLLSKLEFEGAYLTDDCKNILKECIETFKAEGLKNCPEYRKLKNFIDRNN